MRRHQFTGQQIEPAAVFAKVKKFLTDNAFEIDGENVRPDHWDVTASRRGPVRVALGAVRDAAVVVAGHPGSVEVQFTLGIWGKDRVVPVVEGIATLGAAAAVNVHEERRLEEAMWRDLVQLIDPKLQVCAGCGAILDTLEELRTHRSLEAERTPDTDELWEHVEAKVARMN